MKVDGACHCGAIRYEAEIDPADVGICHCRDCQTLTGSAYRVSVRAPAATMRVTGTPSVYIKTADSGTQRAHAFCPTCGAPVFASAVDNPPTYSLRVGALSQRDRLPPQVQQWCQSAVPWSSDLTAIAKREAGR